MESLTASRVPESDINLFALNCNGLVVYIAADSGLHLIVEGVEDKFGHETSFSNTGFTDDDNFNINIARFHLVVVVVVVQSFDWNIFKKEVLD